MTFETGQIPMGGAALSPVESNVIPASSTTGVSPILGGSRPMLVQAFNMPPTSVAGIYMVAQYLLGASLQRCHAHLLEQNACGG